MFPAHFRHQEEGGRQVAKEANLKEGGNKEEEEKLIGGDDEKTVRINKNLPESFKKELLKLFAEY